MFGGAGLGSIIAETALRLGFEDIIIVDGDTIEESNLNRQNYIKANIGKSKVDTLFERLKAINPSARITCHNVFLDKNNLKDYVADCDIAVNAIDFDTDAPFVFDRICKDHNIPVIHPYNYGWAGCALVITPDSQQLSDLEQKDPRFEITVTKHIMHYLENYGNNDLSWLNEAMFKFMEHPQSSPPQLSVGSWLTAGLVTDLLFDLANDLPVKKFPFPYYISSR